MNKSLATNLVAVFMVGIGHFVDPPFRQPLLVAGLFALAGGITNWLAIHMLFNKVPGLYGSGVVSARFEDFKLGIHHLLMNQFFSREKLDHFMQDMTGNNAEKLLDFHDVIDKTDLHPVFTNLVSVIMESSFANMLAMFGGQGVLAPLEQPFITRMRQSLNDIAHSKAFQHSVRKALSNHSISNDTHEQIAQLVQARLDELTAPMVKDIIQTMIRQHLGWLVVWGGVFGGLIGLITSQLQIIAI